MMCENFNKRSVIGKITVLEENKKKVNNYYVIFKNVYIQPHEEKYYVVKLVWKRLVFKLKIKNERIRKI